MPKILKHPGRPRQVIGKQWRLFAERLRAIVEKEGLTQGEAAGKVKVHSENGSYHAMALKTFTDYLRMETQPSIEMLGVFSKAFGVPMAYWFEEKDWKPTLDERFAVYLANMNDVHREMLFKIAKDFADADKVSE